MKKYILFLFGIFCGFSFATMFAGAITGEQGILPSLVFEVGNFGVHLHHWLLSFIILATLIIVNWTTKIFRRHVVFYLINGILVGLIAQGIFMYNDWYKIIYHL